MNKIIFDYINFYNYHREITTLGNLTPIEYKNFYKNNPELMPVYIKSKTKTIRRYN
ncbi:IS3 family transposase [Candidatus Phytoplasma solani]|uniref:IS3 family transposase n=1 Tax=Candidatus Phytoplasma solani TaxID=69896 RepID=UPI0033130156